MHGLVPFTCAPDPIFTGRSASLHQAEKFRSARDRMVQNVHGFAWTPPGDDAATCINKLKSDAEHIYQTCEHLMIAVERSPATWHTERLLYVGAEPPPPSGLHAGERATWHGVFKKNSYVGEILNILPPQPGTGAVPMNRRSLMRFAPEVWLNDECINAGILLLQVLLT